MQEALTGQEPTLDFFVIPLWLTISVLIVFYTQVLFSRVREINRRKRYSREEREGEEKSTKPRLVPLYIDPLLFFAGSFTIIITLNILAAWIVFNILGVNIIVSSMSASSLFFVSAGFGSWYVHTKLILSRKNHDVNKLSRSVGFEFVMFLLGRGAFALLLSLSLIFAGFYLVPLMNGIGSVSPIPLIVGGLLMLLYMAAFFFRSFFGHYADNAHELAELVAILESTYSRGGGGGISGTALKELRSVVQAEAETLSGDGRIA